MVRRFGLAVTAMLFLMGFALAADGEKKGRQIKATVKAVDAAKETLTLTIKGDGGDREMQLKTTGAKILNGEREMKLADLNVGALVTALIDADGQTLKQLSLGAPRRGEGDGEKGARGREIRGTIKAVDAAKEMLTLTIRGEGGDRDLELKLTGAKLLDGEREIKLADLKPGAAVTVLAEGEGRAVKQVNIGVVRRGEGGGERVIRGREIGGTIKAFDAAKETLTLTLSGEGGGKDLELKLTGAKVLDGNQEVKLADLKVGIPVAVILDADGKTVKQVIVGGAPRRGEKEGK